MIVPDLPAWLDKELLRVGAPEAGIAALRECAYLYVDGRDGPSLPGAALRKEADKLETSALKLLDQLQTSDPALGDLIAAAASMAGRSGEVEEMQRALSTFLQTLRLADALIDTQPGKPIEPQTYLAASVTLILEG